MLAYHSIKFPNEKNTDFIDLLRARVKDYFQRNKISQYGNAAMVWKTIFMISLYVVPYLVMVCGGFTSPLILFCLWTIMAFGMSGIGLGVMHDANHGAYSKNPRINKIIGYMLDFIGGSTITWKIQHNTLHHGYTNIDGFDEDISVGKLIRLSPHQPRYRLQRYQHYYAWFFYGISTLYWISAKDYLQLIRYSKTGMLKITHKSFRYQMTEMIIAKSIYLGYLFVIPILFVGVPWWETVLFGIYMHLLASAMITSVFQPAHVMPSNDYPLPGPDGKMENNWAIHEVITTTDFAPKSRFFTWVIGGLNYQVEHHLFPTVCHVHYKEIAKIVRETTSEFGIPYHVQPTFYQAIKNHIKMLRFLGKFDGIKTNLLTNQIKTDARAIAG